MKISYTLHCNNEHHENGGTFRGILKILYYIIASVIAQTMPEGEYELATHFASHTTSSVPVSRTHVQCAILELKVGPAQFPQPTDLRHAVLSAVAGRQAPAGWQAVEVRPLAAKEDASVRRVHV